MKNTNICKVNIIDSTITVTKAFAKKAGIIGTGVRSSFFLFKYT